MAVPVLAKSLLPSLTVVTHTTTINLNLFRFLVELARTFNAYYLGTQIFNNLPLEIKNIADKQNKFKIALKKLLHTYSFYTIKST